MDANPSPVEPAGSAEPEKSAGPDKSVEPVGSAEPDKSAEPAELNKSVGPAGSAEPDKSADPAGSASLLLESGSQDRFERVRGTIFEVREFSLFDGPGVRTTVFFKGCPLRCQWCHNPEGQRPEPEVLFAQQKCVHCGNCANCPPDQLRLRCPTRAKRLCGRRVSAAELAEELLRQKPVFDSIGGGVTFSGGEPLMQPEFLAAAATLLTRQNVQTAIETSGYASPEVYRRALEAISFVYQDLKSPDDTIHRKYTGVSNGPILANIEYLKRSGKPFVIRIPLIPGVNDSVESLEASARLLISGAVPDRLQMVELLPYHLAAGAKYSLVGRKYDDPCAPDRLKEFQPKNNPEPLISVFQKYGLTAKVA